MADRGDRGPDATDRSAAEVISGRNVSGLSHILALEWLTQAWAVDPAELNVAGMAAIASARTAGEGEYTIVEGYDRIPERLAEVSMSGSARQSIRFPGGAAASGCARVGKRGSHLLR